MVFHAVEALDDAIDETKEILAPFHLVNWSKLALVGILAGLGTVMFGGSTDVFEYQSIAAELGISPAMALTIAGIGVTISLLLLFVRSWFTFVMYRCISVKEVTLVKFMREDSNKALRYFGFLFLSGILSFLFLLPIGASMWYELLLIPGVIISFILLATLYIVNIFTRDLVVPKMIDDDLEFVPAFKKVFGTFRNNSSQLAVYLVLRAFVSVTLSIMYGIVVLSALLLVLLVGLPFFAISYLITPFLLVLPALLAVLIWGVIVFVLGAPVNVYLYNYALSFYQRLLDGDIY